MAIPKPTLETLASHLMFSADRSTQGFIQLMEKESVEFRKNKTKEDIDKALQKSKLPRYGHRKTEIEQSVLECYLEDILKLKFRVRRI